MHPLAPTVALPWPRCAPRRLLRAPARAFAVATVVLLAACAGPAPRPSAPAPAPAPSASRGEPSAPAAPVPGRRGGYYADDGPGEGPGPDPMTVPDAQPRREPLARLANRPYVVFGKSYQPMTELAPWRERGVGSWYGRKFHGLKTSNGETYDMYGMTAAHPTLPIPSYARVTNLRNGRSVIVRVNDRGPFLHDRVIDLSYTAAAKLGYAQAGSGEVEVELITRFDGADDAPVQMAQAGGAVAGAATGGAAGGVGAGAPVAPGTGGAASARAASAPPVAQADIEPRLTIETTVNVPPPSGGGAGGLAPATSAASPSAAPPAAGAAAAPARGSVWLQLGAFSTRDNAEAARARLSRQLDWLSGQLAIVPDGAMFKVQAGPFAQRDDALTAAERIRAATDFKPFPTTR